MTLSIAAWHVEDDTGAGWMGVVLDGYDVRHLAPALHPDTPYGERLALRDADTLRATMQPEQPASVPAYEPERRGSSWVQDLEDEAIERGLS